MASVDIYQMTTKDTNHKVAPVTIFDAVVNPLNKKTLDQEFEDMVGAKDESVAVDDADATLVTTALRKTEQVLTQAEKKQVRTNINAADADDLIQLSETVSENKTNTDAKLSELGSKVNYNSLSIGERVMFEFSNPRGSSSSWIEVGLKSGETYTFAAESYNDTFAVNIYGSDGSLLFGLTNSVLSETFKAAKDYSKLRIYFSQSIAATQLNISCVKVNNNAERIEKLESKTETALGENLSRTVNTVIGKEYINSIGILIPKGTPFSVSIKGQEGLLADDTLGNIQVKKSDGNLAYIKSMISSVCYSEIFVLDYDINSLSILRGSSGVVKEGSITLNISTGDFATKNDVLNLYNDISGVNDKLKDTENHISDIENILGKEYSKTVQTKLNEEYLNRVYGFTIPKNTPFKVRIDGDSGLLSGNLLGELKVVTKEGNQFNIDSSLSYISYEKVFTLDYAITSIAILRGGTGVTAVGDITLSVQVAKYVTRNELGNTIEEVKELNGIINSTTEIVNADSRDYLQSSGTLIGGSGNRASYNTKRGNIKKVGVKEGYNYVLYGNNEGLNNRSYEIVGSWTAQEVDISSYSYKYLFMRIRKADDTTIKAADLVSCVYLHRQGLSDKVNELELASYENSVVYVDSVKGNDSNDGSKNTPLSTFAKAMEISGKIVTIVLTGDTTESFNILTGNKESVTLVGKTGTKNRIIKGTKIDNASVYNGNVFYTEMADFPSASKFQLFQHEVTDESTVIDSEERHPLQKGKTHRCDSTKLIRVYSIEDVVSSSTPVFYYDTENLMLYFRIVEGTNLKENPIYIPGGRGIYGNDGSVLFKAVNIEVLYGTTNLQNCHNGEITDCINKYGYGGGGFLWDGAIGLKMVRCESARTFSGSTTGDGFNAHSTTSGDADSKHTVATMIDCWSHDNNDDGFSDHERCETTIIGGLFENNIKAGLTPAYGAHDTIYNSYCRNNKFGGIRYVGATTEAEGGQGGQIYCSGCCCENNDINYSVENDSNSLFENSAILVNCISVNAKSVGFRTVANSRMKLINCSDSGSVVVKEGNVTVVSTNSIL